MPPITEPLSIRQLEVFVALVDEGSFTRAAQALGLSQSTVSGHVADLERRLGALVVERGRRRIRPTAAGDALLAPARETLKAERTTRMAIEELTGLLRGDLAVGGSTIPAVYFLPAVIARFHERYPDIALQLVTGDSRGILEGLLESDLELGVVGVRPDPAQFESVPFGRDSLILVLPPEHRLAGRSELTPEELEAEPMILREHGSGTREAVLGALRGERDEVDLPLSNVVLEVGSNEGQRAAVRAGVGLAFMSDRAVADDLERGTLATVPVRGVEVERDFHLVVRKDAYLSPAARAFRDLALEG